MSFGMFFFSKKLLQLYKIIVLINTKSHGKEELFPILNASSLDWELFFLIEGMREKKKP